MTFIDKDVCMVIYDKVIKPMGFMTETGMTMRVILDVPVDNVYSEKGSNNPATNSPQTLSVYA